MVVNNNDTNLTWLLMFTAMANEMVKWVKNLAQPSQTISAQNVIRHQPHHVIIWYLQGEGQPLWSALHRAACFHSTSLLSSPHPWPLHSSPCLEHPLYFHTSEFLSLIIPLPGMPFFRPTTRQGILPLLFPPALSLSQYKDLFNKSASGGKKNGASASYVFPMNIQGWYPLRLTSLISLLSKGLSSFFSSTTVWKHQFIGTQHSLWYKFHICSWLLGKP